MPYDLRNSSVFSARLNASSDDSDVIAGGSVFQTFAAATVTAVIKISVMLCVGDSLEVKIETDKVEIKTEADGSAITGWPFVVHPTTGMFAFFLTILSLHSFTV